LLIRLQLFQYFLMFEKGNKYNMLNLSTVVKHFLVVRKNYKNISNYAIAKQFSSSTKNTPRPSTETSMVMVTVSMRNEFALEKILSFSRVTENDCK